MKILTVVGARPQFVKAAPVSRAAKRAAIHEVLVHTGQHYDVNMSTVFFDEMNIPAPIHALGIRGGDHGDMTGRMMAALEAVYEAEAPDVVLTYGDTNSTLAAALVAAKANIPIAHVEAGLRAYDRTMPEEINRVVVDHISTYLFCPTQIATENLAKEGIVDGVFHVGDVMYDAALMLKGAPWDSALGKKLGIEVDSYCVATLHRQSTTATKEALTAAVDFLREETSRQPVVIPLHPRTRASAIEFGVDLSGLDIIEPLGPVEMQALLARSTLVITDSGGLQKEAYFHRKPCITLRDSTEWTETIDAGWNRLWSTPDFQTPRREITDFGSGYAADQIVKILLNGHHARA
jgi:UDP-GlcNAc3NAcA epimerase